mmetsp:Transcript_11007/g.23258  ORF Transcript_11007/g.23258 Transcript_11007/m.23258 type:complete len:283 (+) Transcript_11007:50-898(+)
MSRHTMRPINIMLYTCTRSCDGLLHTTIMVLYTGRTELRYISTGTDTENGTRSKSCTAAFTQRQRNALGNDHGRQRLPPSGGNVQIQELNQFINKGPGRSEQRLDVVVTGPVDPKRLGPPLLRQCQEQVLSVPERYDLILRSVDYEYRTLYRRSVVDIGKFVPPHGKSKVEGDAVGAQEGRLEDNACDAPSLPRGLGGEVAGGSAPQRPAVENNLLRLEMPYLEQIAEGGLDVGVAVILVGRAVALAVAGVVVGHYVNPKDARQVVEPVVDHAQIFGVAVRE